MLCSPLGRLGVCEQDEQGGCSLGEWARGCSDSTSSRGGGAHIQPLCSQHQPFLHPSSRNLTPVLWDGPERMEAGNAPQLQDLREICEDAGHPEKMP